MAELAAVSWLLVMMAWAALVAYAVTMHHAIMQRMRQKSPPAGEVAGQGEAAGEAEVVQFLTARRSANCWLLGCSLYANMMGAWAVSVPAAYASEAGALGLAAYAAAQMLGVLLLAALGTWVNRAFPSATSLPDFLRWRFGSAGVLRGEGIRWLIACVSLFNMCIPLLAEFATVASLFKGFVGTAAWPAVAIQGLSTLGYTALGGLAVSLLTDRVQMLGALVMLVCLLVVVISATCGPDAPALAPMTAELKGFTTTGFSGILTQPLTITTFVLFNEGAWQRVWASASERDLWRGAAIGAVLAGSTVALFGTGGLLAIRAGRTGSSMDPNLYFFALFSDGGLDGSWEGVLVLLAACVMSMAAVDSFQLGIQGILSSTLFQGFSLRWTRAVLLAVNAPLIAIASAGLAGSALDLFLMEAMVTCCCAAPVVLAILPLPESWRAAYTEPAALSSIAAGAVCLSLYGLARADWRLEGLHVAWCDNGYAYDYYLVAALVPALVSTAWVGLARLFRASAARGRPGTEAKARAGEAPAAEGQAV